jgi:hypothetical protein
MAEDRPAWWKAAVADYLAHDASPLMSMLAWAQTWTSGADDAALAWSGWETEPAFRAPLGGESQGKEIDRRFDGNSGLRTILYRRSREGGSDSAYILEVEDLGFSRTSRTVAAGIAGKWEILERSIQLDLRDHALIGDVEIPGKEIDSLGSECRLIPAVDSNGEPTSPEPL